MSSPAPSFAPSPSLSPAGGAPGPGRRRSQFTYRHLSQLASSATTCPLRVIAHIDLDAFYAQCEMVRLGVAEDQPLAVQQWQGLIAINYPARKFGIGRMCTIEEARKLCPDLIAQHVATWKEGEEKWAYHADAAANIATHKVSLDPYRLESRKILAVIKGCLPPGGQKVEKASIDEVFIDLSAQVHAILLERFKDELARPPPYGDPSEKLPLPPVSGLDWQADALVDLDDAQAEADEPDWDDVAILVGSEIVRNIRAAVRERLKYTCSAGIACNKVLSKLGSGYRKPNQQTVVRGRAAQHFLSGFKFTKIRSLGGKLGDQVARAFETDTVEGLLAVPVEQLKARLGDETGVWVYNTIRGVDQSEVSSRTQIKSMLSAKSFRPSITTYEQAVKWLRIFAADIFSRLVEEGVLENKRRPKTINLHHRHGGQTRSRQSPIPQGRTPDEEVLFGLAKTLLGQIVREGHVWPCSNLSLSVGGFEDGITGNMGIGSFLVKGEEAQALLVRAVAPSDPRSDPRSDPISVDAIDTLALKAAEKRPRPEKEEGMGIERFFTKKRSALPEAQGHDNMADMPFSPAAAGGDRGWAAPGEPGGNTSDTEDREPGVHAARKRPHPDASLQQAPITAYMCSRCSDKFATRDALQSHEDWHYATDLQEQEEQEEQQERERERERVRPTFASHPTPRAATTSSSRSRDGNDNVGGKSSINSSSGGGGGGGGSSSSSGSIIRKDVAAAASKKGSRPKKLDPGQSKLSFG